MCPKVEENHEANTMNDKEGVVFAPTNFRRSSTPDHAVIDTTCQISEDTQRRELRGNCAGSLELLRPSCGLLASLLRQEVLVDVGKDTASGDRHFPEVLGQLLVVADRELDVAGGDPLLLPVPGSVASELEGLRNEVLEDRGEVHRCPGAHPLRVAFLLQEPADPTDRERQAGLRALRLPAGCLLPLLPALALPRHSARSVVVRAPL